MKYEVSEIRGMIYELCDMRFQVFAFVFGFSQKYSCAAFSNMLATLSNLPQIIGIFRTNSSSTRSFEHR